MTIDLNGTKHGVPRLSLYENEVGQFLPGHQHQQKDPQQPKCTARDVVEN